MIELLTDSLFWSLSSLVITKDDLTGSHSMFVLISEPVAGGPAVTLWSL